MYASCTASHAALADEWFLPSLQDSYELILERSRGFNGENRYKDAAWMAGVAAKVDLILRALTENNGSIFIFSDVDIRFFSKTEPAVREIMRGCDLAVLQDSPFGALGTGFFACRSNAATKRLWTDVREFMRRHPDCHDQEALNALWYQKSDLRRRALWKSVSFFAHLPVPGLRFKMKTRLLRTRKRLGNLYGIRLDYFPETFWSPGIASEKVWTRGHPLRLPPGAVLHHANWTSGVTHKMAQLEEAKPRQDRPFLNPEVHPHAF